MDMINIDEIARNSNNFDFVAELGNFINNLQFKAGND